MTFLYVWGACGLVFGLALDLIAGRDFRAGERLFCLLFCVFAWPAPLLIGAYMLAFARPTRGRHEHRNDSFSDAAEEIKRGPVSPPLLSLEADACTPPRLLH